MRISSGMPLYFSLDLCCNLGNLGPLLDNSTKTHTGTSESVLVALDFFAVVLLAVWLPKMLVNPLISPGSLALNPTSCKSIVIITLLEHYTDLYTLYAALHDSESWSCCGQTIIIIIIVSE